MLSSYDEKSSRNQKYDRSSHRGCIRGASTITTTCDDDGTKNSKSSSSSSPSFTTDHFRKQLDELKAENISLQESNTILASKNHAIAKKLSKTESVLAETKVSLRKLSKKLSDERHLFAAAKLHQKKQIIVSSETPSQLDNQHQRPASLAEILWLHQPPPNNKHHHRTNITESDTPDRMKNTNSSSKNHDDIQSSKKELFSSPETMKCLSPKSFISRTVELENTRHSETPKTKFNSSTTSHNNEGGISNSSYISPPKDMTKMNDNESSRKRSSHKKAPKAQIKIFDEQHQQQQVKDLVFPIDSSNIMGISDHQISAKPTALMEKENGNKSNQQVFEMASGDASCDINHPWNGIETPPRPRRRSSLGISYREPALNAKMRQGFVFFPISSTPTTTTKSN